MWDHSKVSLINLTNRLMTILRFLYQCVSPHTVFPCDFATNVDVCIIQLLLGKGRGTQWLVFQESEMQVRFKFCESHCVRPHRDESGPWVAAWNSSSSVVWQREREATIYFMRTAGWPQSTGNQCWEWHRHIRTMVSRARFIIPSAESNCYFRGENAKSY